ncbi:hypothetical protein MG293_011157 [Ovis ammon polii]|uniref:Uncharacterized protein n=1 Tax=Ovis ammon polii TaxID=230172 RepID=A0AAD4U7D7_OVIAM|nr:hypothetical protein MG293_011157 [Ovis ammon polii]KAI4565308.1 hypothetical protein MJT46_009651 [Ovis ammon polii x Ovis aries]
MLLEILPDAVTLSDSTDWSRVHHLERHWASLTMALGLQACGFQELQHTGSAVAACGLESKGSADLSSRGWTAVNRAIQYGSRTRYNKRAQSSNISVDSPLISLKGRCDSEKEREGSSRRDDGRMEIAKAYKGRMKEGEEEESKSLRRQSGVNREITEENKVRDPNRHLLQLVTPVDNLMKDLSGALAPSLKPSSKSG